MNNNHMTIQITIEPLVLDVDDGNFRPAIKIMTKFGCFENEELIKAGRDYDKRGYALQFANDWAKMRRGQFEKMIKADIYRQHTWMESKEYKQLLARMKNAVEEGSQKLFMESEFMNSHPSVLFSPRLNWPTNWPPMCSLFNPDEDGDDV